MCAALATSCARHGIRRRPALERRPDDELHRELVPLLRRPIARITGKDVPPPVSKPLEAFVLLNDDDIRAGLTELAHR